MSTKYATDYCETIADELKHLTNIIAPDTPQEYATSLEALEMEHVEQGDELFTWLNESCLEITKNYDDDGELLGYTILRTCGGPRCEIRRELRDGENFYVDTWDGSEYSSLRVSLRDLAFNLDELISY